MRCPHCKGELREARETRWHYECSRCGRAWFVKDDLWFALFDASGHIYRKTKSGKFEWISDRQEWEKLWEEAKQLLER